MRAMPSCSRDFGGRFFNSVSVRYDDNSRFGDKVTWRIAPA